MMIDILEISFIKMDIEYYKRFSATMKIRFCSLIYRNLNAINYVQNKQFISDLHNSEQIYILVIESKT